MDLFKLIWQWILNLIVDEYFLSILSIVSFVFSVVTFFISYRINNKIKVLKWDTIDKVQFNAYRTNYLVLLKTHTESIKQAETLSRSICRDVSTILTRLSAYDNIFTSEDMDKLHNLSQTQKEIPTNSARRLQDSNMIDTELTIITELISILEKGVYCI